MANTRKNDVRIEGILSEVDLKEGSFKRDGNNVDCISGIVKIKVNQEINKEMKHLEIPIHVFCAKTTLAGKENPSFTSIKKVKDEFISIAACGNEAEADCVSVGGARIEMNEYYGASGNLISFPRIHASFFNRVKREELDEKAIFTIEFYVRHGEQEVDKEGNETGRYRVMGAVEQYNIFDLVPFYVVNPSVINAVTQYWQVGDTVQASGRINFSSTVEKYTITPDFGEPVVSTRTISVNDLIITGGTQTPEDEERALSVKEVEDGLAARAAKLEEIKNRNTKTEKVKSAPAHNANDVGF